jgi:hypothetical protein
MLWNASREVAKRWWRHLLILGMILALVGQPADVARAATVYYVATTGSDSNNGTSLSTPFRTINKCATVAYPGDTCLIRAGTYRETVNVARSGAAGSPITFMPYNNEQVTVSGANVISAWTAHDVAGGKRIFRANMPFTMNVRSSSFPNYQITNNQVFVDGQMMPEARWPNIPPALVTRQSNAYQARSDGATNHAQYSVTYQDSDLTQFATNFWQGGKINFSPGYKIEWTTCDVTGNSSNTVSLQCNPDPGAFNNRSRLQLPGQGDFYIPGPRNPYYLWGKYAALDAAGEWFRDASGTLYLWTPDGSDPSTKLVEARARPYAFNLYDRAYITIKGLRLFAAGIQTSGASDYLVIDEIESYYSWHFQEIPPFYWQLGTKGMMLAGDQSVIQNSVLAYSAGSIADLSFYYDENNPPSNNNRFINNVAFDTAYMANQAGITAVNPGGANTHLMERNTLFYAGNVLVDMALGNIRYNDLYQSHQQISDLGTIYTWNSDGLGAETAYNFVHDNYGEWNQAYSFWGGNGIFPDDGARNYVIHHNLIWNHTSNGLATFGIEPPGAGGYRKFYNNTVDGSVSFGVKPERQQTNVGTEVRNNIIVQTSDNYNDPNLTKSNNLIGNGLYINPSAADYRLRLDSPAIDAGMTLPPYTNGFLGAAPDIGALESGGGMFMAGALVRAKDVAALIATCKQEAEGSTAACQITNLPLGRKLPLDFEIRIGDAPSAQGCWTTMNYTSHLGQAACQGVPTGGQSGTQTVFGRLAGGAWASLGSISLGNLAIFTVAPNNGPTSGGTAVTITGRRFQPAAGGVSFAMPISISNPHAAPLYDYQVPVTFNSAALVSAGKMRSDCGDMRFYDAYGALAHWLEMGCNTTVTRAWVRVQVIPPGNSTITLAYGDSALSSTSSGAATFFFFDDFNDGAASPYVYWDNTPGITIQESSGALRVIGTTTTANQYDSWGFFLRTWLFPFPANWAIDSELTVATGPLSFKAVMGNWDMSVYDNTTPKKIGYYSGDWVQLGTSVISTGTPNRHRLSLGVFGPNKTGKTLYWFENGAFTTPRASRVLSGEPSWGGFRYGPNAAGQTFDGRFDNVRVRNFAYPEPQVTTGAEASVGARFTFGGTACANLRVIDSTRATCQTPPRSAGTVPVAVTNPGGDNAAWNGYTYTSGTLTAPTQINPQGVATLTMPTYSWSELSAATRYSLVVYHNATGNAVVNQEIAAGAVCAGGTCSHTPGAVLTNGGEYSWYVVGGNASAWGPWSSGKAFVVSLPLTTAPTPTAPLGLTTGTLTPTYRWTGVTGAVNYAIAVFDLETLTVQVFQSFAASAVCNGLTCQATPTGTGTTLLNGRAYGWFVSAGNFAGWGPWSAGLAFYAFVTPGVPTLVSPSGTVGNPVTYVWNRVQGATAYYLAAYRTGEAAPLFSGWHNAADVCGGSTCQVAQPGSLTNGGYTFYVMSQNPAGQSAFSSPKTFTVSGSTAPEIAPTFAP